jgi:hypothetical protein
VARSSSVALHFLKLLQFIAAAAVRSTARHKLGTQEMMLHVPPDHVPDLLLLHQQMSPASHPHWNTLDIKGVVHKYH